MTWWKRLAPMIVLQVFLWGTFAAFEFGPWAWPMRDPSRLAWFVVGCHVALLLGYLGVAHRSPGNDRSPVDPKRLFAWSLAVTALMLPLTSYAKTGQWVPDVMGALTNPGQAYAESHAYMENATNFGTYLRVVFGAVLAACVPIGVFYWSRWSRRIRVAFVATAATIVLLSVATGQRRDIADLFIIISLVSLGAHWAGVTKWSRRAMVTGVTVCAIGMAVFAAYFIVSHVSRVGQKAAGYGANPVTKVAPNPDSVLLNIVPSDVRPGFLGLMHYFTTGYYGLSLALEREVEPMYGFGHSMFLTRNYERFTKTPGFEDRSLAVQISDNDGFKYPVQWCTAYPYFANDLGFLGTVLLMFVLGRLFGLAWIDVLGGASPRAVVVFSLLATLLFYLPATNRMLQDGEGVVAVYTWLAVWLLSRAPAFARRRELVTA